MDKGDLKRINDFLWEVPQNYRGLDLTPGFEMRVPARIYATEKMLEDIVQDRSIKQLINVSTLPGIEKYAVAMPDIHEGYGFPIGGVAAFNITDGIVSPGGIGYDINCGVRLLVSDLDISEAEGHLREIGREIYRGVPSGVGHPGIFSFSVKEIDKILRNGVSELIKMGYCSEEDVFHIESQGCLSEADPSMVSTEAKSRGKGQLGTIGSGNHFVEVEKVEDIFDQSAASSFGLRRGQIVVLIHTGSRGLGHQVATDYIELMMGSMKKYGISIPDRELSCVPFSSKEGGDYWRAMSAAANFAWANRQMVSYEVERAWKKIFGGSGLKLLYDVAHNIAKIERHIIDGKEKEVVVHRKGATRSFTGEPVLIPGSMGTCSYLLLGSDRSMLESFGSSCHGAGRILSRTEAKRRIRGSELKDRLEKSGVVVNAGSMSGIAEEAPEAYKDVDEVVDVVVRAGIAKKVAKLKPIAVIKG